MKFKNKWSKLPSVSRPNRFFYYSENRTILQDWSGAGWYLFENGRPSDKMFKTPQEVMKFAETNVVH